MKVRLVKASDNVEIGICDFQEVPMTGDTVVYIGKQFVVDDRVWRPHEYVTLRLLEAIVVVPEKEAKP